MLKRNNKGSIVLLDDDKVVSLRRRLISELYGLPVSPDKITVTLSGSEIETVLGVLNQHEESETYSQELEAFRNRTLDARLALNQKQPKLYRYEAALKSLGLFHNFDSPLPLDQLIALWIEYAGLCSKSPSRSFAKIDIGRLGQDVGHIPQSDKFWLDWQPQENLLIHKTKCSLSKTDAKKALAVVMKVTPRTMTNWLGSKLAKFMLAPHPRWHNTRKRK